MFAPWQAAGETASAEGPARTDWLEVALTDVRLPEVMPDPVPEEVSVQDDMRVAVNGKITADYMEMLKRRIFNLWEYPATAVAEGRSGDVSVFFVLDRSGQVGDVMIRASSGSEDLDLAAMMAVQESSPFGPFTADMPDERLELTVYFKYVFD